MRWKLLAAIAGMTLAGCGGPEANQAKPANDSAPLAKAPAGVIKASFDCAAARGQAQELICGDANLAAMDREAARLSGGDPAGQAAWATRRDDCWKDDDLRHCVMAGTVLRIHQLRQAGTGDGEGISVGPVTWRCAGIDGPVTATFVNSDPGAVALQWSGVAIAIDRAAAASGVRYEGRWDGEPISFWTKGREATLTVAGKGDLACREQAPASPVGAG